MKKCINGEYIEMTAEEVSDWEQAQQEIEDSNESSSGGGVQINS